MLELVRIADDAVVSVHEEAEPFVDLPDGAGRVSPLVAGWEGGGALTVVEVPPAGGDGLPVKSWEEGPARYLLRAAP